jgi:YidC/Oxa1 family membrane protein insertase
MNDIRRTILWVIFGFAMVMLWDKWQVHNGNQPTFFPPAPEATATAPAGAPASAPGAAATGVPPAVPGAVPTPAAATGAAAVPGTAAPGVPPTAAAGPATAAPRERITVTTDVLRWCSTPRAAR